MTGVSWIISEIHYLARSRPIVLLEHGSIIVNEADHGFELINLAANHIIVYVGWREQWVTLTDAEQAWRQPMCGRMLDESLPQFYPMNGRLHTFAGLEVRRSDGVLYDDRSMKEGSRFRNVCGTQKARGQSILLWIPFWMLLVVFGAYPLLILVGFRTRRWRRRRRGQCTKCGYNLTGNTSGVCPECGTAVHTPASENDARNT